MAFYYRNLFDLNEILEKGSPQAAQDLLGLKEMPRGHDANSYQLMAILIHLYNVSGYALLKKKIDQGAGDHTVRSLLYVTVTEGYTGIVRFLLEWGADPNDYSEQHSVLQIAVTRGHREITRLLMKYRVNVKALHCSGKTALHFCTEGYHDSHELMTELLDSGLCINDADSINGNTPLHLAIFQNKLEIARVLVERGADLNIKNINGCTPAHLAVKSLPMLELLLDRNVDLKIADENGLPPLGWVNLLNLHVSNSPLLLLQWKQTEIK